MAIQITKTKRKFVLNGKDKDKTILDDPNPAFTPDEVMSFYAGTYPQLTNGSVSGPKLEGSDSVYEFKTSLGEKG